MWRNIFYVHNYFGFENMCLTHTHQVGIDMQLFLFASILMYIWHYNKKVGLALAGIIAILSTVLRYVITVEHSLSLVIYPGISIKQMFDSSNLTYILPTHRATIYITGVLLAYILRTAKFTLNKLQVGICWFLAISSGLLAIFSPFYMTKINYVYSKTDAAIYGAFSPILWGIATGWTIFASNHGYAGWFGDFLSWKGFQLFTKIAYAFYLVQFPVFFYNVGVQKNPDEYKPHILLHFSEVAVILLLSVILTLVVEMPFQKLKGILFPSHYDKTYYSKVVDQHKLKRG